MFAENRRQDLEDPAHKVAFIVGSAEDRDCDGLVDDDPMECFPAVHRGEGPASRTPTCLHTNQATGSCTLGVPYCRDGTGIDTTSCHPTRVCLPSNVCETCMDPLGSYACAQDYQAKSANTVGTYGLDCVIPALIGATEMMLCGDEILVSIVPPPGFTCEDVGVKARDDAAFTDTFSLDGTNKAATVKVSASACDLKVVASGRVLLATASVPVDYGALMVVKLEGELGIAAPVHVRIMQNSVCADRGFCTWVDAGSPDNPNACIAAVR